MAQLIAIIGMVIALLLFLIPPALFLTGCLASRSGRPVTPIEAAIEAVPRNAQQFRGYGIEKTPD